MADSRSLAHDAPDSNQGDSLRQAYALLHLDHQLRGEQPTSDHSKLAWRLTTLLESTAAQQLQVFDLLAAGRSDRSLAAHLATKARRPKQMDYRPQVDVDRLLHLADAVDQGLDDSRTTAEGRKAPGEAPLPFMEFLKKKTFEEFRVGQQQDTGAKSAIDLDVVVHKTPVGPWGDGRPQTSANTQPIADHRTGAYIEQPSRQKPAKGLGSFFSKEHNDSVIGKYGGFTSGVTELQRAKKEAVLRQHEDEYKPLYEDVPTNKTAKTGGNFSDDFVSSLTGRVLGDPSIKVSKKFVPPISKPPGNGGQAYNSGGQGQGNKNEGNDKYPGLDNKLVETIEREIMQEGTATTWDDIAGLESAKRMINEIVVWPLKRPELFKGLRQAPKGLLLFGPPGTGKTMIGRAIAGQLQYTFFNMSASSLTSKWVGEGEKLVKTLFELAKMKQPAVIFIDEIDSLLCSRSENENEASRRIKTEFLVQLDGARSTAEDKILMIGATNRPEELDEAARRRFIKRLYVPLPDSKAREDLIVGSIRKDEAYGGTKYELTAEQVAVIVEKTKGYSAADMHNLIVEAAMAPLRSVDIMHATAENLRAVDFGDFQSALKTVKSSVSGEEVERYRIWNKKFGSTEFEEEK